MYSILEKLNKIERLVSIKKYRGPPQYPHLDDSTFKKHLNIIKSACLVGRNTDDGKKWQLARPEQEELINHLNSDSEWTKEGVQQPKLNAHLNPVVEEKLVNNYKLRKIKGGIRIVYFIASRQEGYKLWRQIIIDGSVKLCEAVSSYADPYTLDISIYDATDPRWISLFMGKKDGSIIGKMTVPHVYSMDEALKNEFDHM